MYAAIQEPLAYCLPAVPLRKHPRHHSTIVEIDDSNQVFFRPQHPYAQRIQFATPAPNPYCKPSAADSAIDRNR